MMKHTITQADIDNKEPFVNDGSKVGEVVDIEPSVETGAVDEDRLVEKKSEDELQTEAEAPKPDLEVETTEE